MFTKLFSHRWMTKEVSVQRAASVQSIFDLGIEMKLLNDKKQFPEALHLFDKHKGKSVQTLSNLIIIQALKACTHTGDLQRAKTIHQLILPRIYNDSYILTSLIHLYMQCGDVKQAQLLFNQSSNKTLAMYGAMIKGYITNNLPKKAIDLFNQIQNPNEVLILLLFNACAQLRTSEALNIVEKVYKQMPHSSYSNSRLLTSLLDALVECGDIKQAEFLFKKSKKKVSSIYGAMIKGYIKNNQSDQAIQLFKQIQNPDQMTLTLLFNACAHLANTEALNLIKQVSSNLPQTSFSNSYILTSLLDALMKCDDVKHAEFFFNKSSNKTLAMYGAMIRGYNKNNLPKKAIDLFNQISNPDQIILTFLFNACAQLANEEALNLVKTVSKQLPDSFHSNSHLFTSLLDALMKCGDVEHAQILFNQSSNKTLSMYGAMIKGYIINNLSNKAIDLFNEIKNPDEVLILLLFNACAQLRTSEALNIVEKVYKQMPHSFYSNSRLLTSLLDALVECGDIKQAEFLFNKSTKKIVSVYGVMMKGYIANNMSDKAIDLFNQISNPDEVCFILLFNACAQLANEEALNLVKTVSKQLPDSFHSNSHLFTSLLDALMKCGDVEHAQILFNQSSNKTLSMYGAMIKGYIINNLSNKAIDLFNEIKNPDEVLILLLFNACAQLRTSEALNIVKKVCKQMPDEFYRHSHLSASLLDVLIKCEDISSAEMYFSQMKKSVTNYGILMNGYNKDNNPCKTLELFDQMKNNGIEADMIIYLRIIKALSKIGVFSTCEPFVEQIPQAFFLDHQIPNALIDMWGKIGHVDKAKEVFENISHPDGIAYTTMINSYGLNGQGIRAIELFRQIPTEELIDEATYVCVLNACSHSGLVSEARFIFENIEYKTERIYTTMIDCLSRASFFDEVQELIEKYECDHPPARPMYMALLSGARNINHFHLSQQVYDRMKQLFPHMTNPLISAAVLLANVYASAGHSEQASNIRIRLNKSGIKKKIGLTWTVVNGQVYQFRAHDKSHPRSKEIYAEGEQISRELIEHGHQYDSSWITRSLNADESVESVLCGHSERLAIAWNFVVNPTASQIQLTKNLRVCGDCHRATKLIAAIRQCEIIVRDANRIHHFYPNGQCSCNDYF